MNEDFDIDDIIEESKTKPRKKSGKKGKRVELGLCKVLNERFQELLSKHTDWGQFSRSVGSGNRWGQKVHLPKAAKDTYTGDITCPTNFRFCLESKGGYNDIDLFAAFEGGHKELDEFLKQAEDDGNRTGRSPMLVWKKDRKPRLAFIKSVEASRVMSWPKDLTEYFFTYRDWTGLSLASLLQLDDSFFFDLD